MELKKGDVVAVVAEVVAERDGKIIISIPGATVSEDLIIAPRKPIRILERSPSPGDEVLYRNEIPCIFRRNETQTVVSLVRDGMPHDDPTSYLFANIKDIRRLDQSGTVKFVSTERSFPNSETGREAMAELEAHETDAAASRIAAVDASRQEEDDVSTTRQENDPDAITIAQREPNGIEEAPYSTGPIDAEDAAVLPSAENGAGENASEQVILPPEDAQADAQSNSPDDAAAPDVGEDDVDVDESDKITIEMPEGFAPRTQSEDAIERTPVLPAPELAEPLSEAVGEEVVRPEPVTIEDTNVTADSHDALVTLPEEDETEDQSSAPEDDAAASDAEDHDGTAETSVAAEMTQEELRERDLRIGKLRQETISNLNGDNGANSENPAPSPAPTTIGSSIFPNLDDLDD